MKSRIMTTAIRVGDSVKFNIIYNINSSTFQGIFFYKKFEDFTLCLYKTCMSSSISDLLSYLYTITGLIGS